VSSPTIWSVLGIAPTKDATLIRRAYAAALKRTNPDDDATGFARLRAAYEQALRQALVVDRGEPPGPARDAGTPAAREPPRTPESRQGAAPASAPSDLDGLRSAFATLQRVVTAAQVPGTEDMHAALDACLRSPALGNISVQLQFEAAMARFLLATQPRTESLLGTVVEHWDWRLRQRSAAADGISAIVGLAENVNVLEEVRASSPRAYLAVTTPPRAVLLWTQIVAFRLDSAVRELLSRLRADLPKSVNPQALAWWSQFLTRPQPRPVLIRFAGVLAVLGTVVGAFVGLNVGSPDRVLSDASKGGVAGVLAGLAMIGLFLGLVDWPRYILRLTRRAASRWVTLGWAPTGLLLCLISGLCPTTTAIVVIAFVLSIALVLWAILMTPENAGITADDPLRRVGVALFTNAPVAVWWALLAGASEGAPTLAMWPVFSATVIAFAIGQPLLWREFLGGLSRKQRQLVRLGVAAIAMGSIPVLLSMPGLASWSGVVLAYVFSVVLTHRTAAVNLNVRQAKLRYFVTGGFAWFLATQRGELSADSLLPDIGALFMAGVITVMVWCLDNESKDNPGAAPAVA
jgi:hypothetical protein